MPDRSIFAVADKQAILGVRPSPGAIEVDAPFHRAVFKIIKTGSAIPRANGITAISAQSAVDHAQPCCLKRPQCHLMPAQANIFLNDVSVNLAGNYGVLVMVESITIYNCQIF